ncbi:MAG: dihydrolipoamide acetyltransferase family protein [Methanomassiliicoccus sp.]|nr:dihydrolipoamide acetyltransferase family protein [Methanomassiliicoccus sp.]
MAKDFMFPDLGEGVTEGEIKKWLVKVGDEVRKDQPIAEVETDKAVVEMPSPYSGKVLKLSAAEGGIVKVGEVLATIGGEGETVSAAEPPSSTSVVGELPETDEEVVTARPSPSAPPSAGVQATPAVRKLARDLKVDLASIKGTGPQGRVTEEDVKRASAPSVEAPEPAMKAKFDLYGWVDRRPLRGIRRSTARHMMEAQANAALVTTMEVVDVTDLVTLRERINKQAQEAKGIKLTYLPFIVKAVIASLKRHPYMNSSMDEEAEEIVIKKYYNLGIAVATEDGLMVPVVKAADQKDLFTLAKEIKDLAQAAADRKVDLADLKGGTFSITNYGVFGSTYATPIPNYPEAAILGVGRIQDAPLVVGGAVVPRKVMHLALTFDHRIMDGAQAASFLTDLRQMLEGPEALLLDL